MPEPMLVVDFPGGGHLSIEFIDDAPDDDRPRLGAWLELRANDPGETMRLALAAGLKEVKHPGHPYYVLAPGGYENAPYLDMSVPYAAGSLYSTVEDLYLWDRALYTDKLLRADLKKTMFAPF